MNGEIVGAVTAACFVAGEMADVGAAWLASRKPAPPANPGWHIDDEDLLPISTPEVVETKESRFTRLRHALAPYASHIALGCAGIGLSATMLALPSDRGHSRVQLGVGVVVDGSNLTAGGHHKSPIYLTLGNYVASLANTNNFQTNMHFTSQGNVYAEQPDVILNQESQPLGQANMGSAIEESLLNSAAVIVLTTGDTQIGYPNYSSPSLSGLASRARSIGERIFVLDVNADGAKPSTTGQQQLAKETGGQVYSSDQTSPQALIDKVTKELLPPQERITTHVDSDKPYWGAALGLSVVGTAIAALRRKQSVIGRTFKHVKRSN